MTAKTIDDLVEEINSIKAIQEVDKDLIVCLSMMIKNLETRIDELEKEMQ